MFASMIESSQKCVADIKNIQHFHDKNVSVG